MVRQEEGTTRLLSGYQLDMGGDPCVVVVRRKDGTVVARFTHNVDPEEIRQAAEEDCQGPSSLESIEPPTPNGRRLRHRRFTPRSSL